MRVYVAGSLTDVEAVRAAQAAVVAAGHELVLDWTRGLDVDEVAGCRSPAAVAEEDLGAVMVADAVLVLPGPGNGKGLFVELGAALSRVLRGDAVRVGVLGDRDQSVFLRHPVVEQVRDVAAWLASARPEDDG